MANILWPLLNSWSRERAWWFGVFLGDGCAPANGSGLTCTGSFSTTVRWRALVTDFKEGIREVKHSPGTFVCSVCSRALSDWMKQIHGYSGKKSHLIRWPEELPAEFKPDFLRGLIDTDGHLSIYDRKAHGQRGNPTPIAAYRSLSLPMVERVRDELAALCGVTKVKPLQAENLTWGISYGGSSTMKVADLLYGNAPEHLRNEDRMDVYREMVLLRDKLMAPCACGNPETFTDGLCYECFEKTQVHVTGPGTLCGACKVRPVVASERCDICRKREDRAAKKAAGTPKKTYGACACGSPATRKGTADRVPLCEACYARKRRGVPLRSALAVPEGGWHSRAGESLPGRPRTADPAPTLSS